MFRLCGTTMSGPACAEAADSQVGTTRMPGRSAQKSIGLSEQ